MSMTLQRFIETGGVPAEEAFYLYHPQAFSGPFDCVADKAYLNRNVPCGLAAKLRRKAHYDFGLGPLPVRRPDGGERVLFWGRSDGAMRLASLPSFFRQLGRWPGTGFTVVVGMSDDTFGDAEAALVPANVDRVFAMNADTAHGKVRWYPLGRDYKGLAHFGLRPRPDKQKLAYCNFSPSTHPDRRRILELLKGKPFVERVQIDGYGEYSGYPLTSREFLGQLNDHAFAICPRGAGFDTYRLWDCLHLGVIPITVKEAAFQREMENLPVLFLDSPEHFGDLTAAFLEQRRREMCATEYDFSPLTAACWRDRFQHVSPA